MAIGLIALALALAAIGLYMHKRHAYWPGFVLVAIAGVLLAVTAQGQWIARMIGQIPYAPFAIMAIGLVVIGLDIKDKRPDKPAVYLALTVPMFLALGIAQTPDVFNAVSDALAHLGVEAQAASRTK
jgi:hypothetical protein